MENQREKSTVSFGPFVISAIKLSEFTTISLN